MSSILNGTDAAKCIKDILEFEGDAESLKFEFKDSTSDLAEEIGIYAKKQLNINLEFMYDEEEGNLVAYYQNTI